MPRQTRPWKEQMNRGTISWQQEQEEKKEQKTLDDWEKEENKEKV